MFGKETYLSWGAVSYGAVLAHIAVEAPSMDEPWLLDVDMHTGLVQHYGAWSLSAYWPGFLSLAGAAERWRCALSLWERAVWLLSGGQNWDWFFVPKRSACACIEAPILHSRSPPHLRPGLQRKAARQVGQWMGVWRRFGALPEMFEVTTLAHHPTHNGYPLRPELAESLFYVASGDEDERAGLIEAGAEILAGLQSLAPARCGFAGLRSVLTRRQDDVMESFFLSETLKYLLLLFRGAGPVLDRWVLSTEGHLLEPWRSRDDDDQLQGSCPVLWADRGNGSWLELGPAPPHTSLALDPGTCAAVCAPSGAAATAEAADRGLASALPLLRPPPAEDMPLLRERRCMACHAFQHAEGHVWTAKHRRWLARHRPGSRRGAGGTARADASAQQPPGGAPISPQNMRHFLCEVAVHAGELACRRELVLLKPGEPWARVRGTRYHPEKYGALIFVPRCAAQHHGITSY